MKRLLLALAVVLLAAPAAWAGPAANQWVGISDAAGDAVTVTGNKLDVNASVTPSGTQDVNVKTINGTTTSTGTGAQGAGAQRVTVATDSATVAGSASVPTGANIVGRVGLDQTTPGTTNAASIAQIGATTVSTGTGAQGAGALRVTVATDTATVAGSATIPAGTNLIGKAGIDQTTPGTTNGVSEVARTTSELSTYASPSLEFSKVVKSGAGNLYSIDVTNHTTAVVWLMGFNATSVPANGAVTPVICIPIPAATAATSSIASREYPMGYPFGTGITFATSTSTTGCFSKTLDTGNGQFFSVRYK